MGEGSLGGKQAKVKKSGNISEAMYSGISPDGENKSMPIPRAILRGEKGILESMWFADPKTGNARCVTFVPQVSRSGIHQRKTRRASLVLSPVLLSANLMKLLKLSSSLRGPESGLLRSG
jgi:hypothetical protein